ncbi:MAG: sigma-70 family RNA polymerase sigma factor [Phycisphaeraceae bacterium]|nr:sigma-70 family RNA polymerase sigma factor [Phycisphaeraceae bacterium]MCW5763816.1 sigma-70 family RNA polymerase sigma factor [Phycisphaeraceae bacterium]
MPDLLRQISAGDQTAVVACIDEYGGLIWRLAQRYLSQCPGEIEDAVQEVFVDLWTHASRFDPARGSEPAFVAIIAHRKLIDYQRRMKVRFTLPIEDHDAPASLDPAKGRSDDFTKIAQAFDQLPPDERNAIWMSLNRGMSQRQIAQATASPEGTVKSRLRRGLIRLCESVAINDRAVPMRKGGGA